MRYSRKHYIRPKLCRPSADKSRRTKVPPHARKTSGTQGTEAQLEDKTDKLYEFFMENRKPPI